MHHLINLLIVVLFVITLLHVLVAVMLTGALCTAVFGGTYALSLLDAWCRTVPNGRADAMPERLALGLATLAVAGLLSAVTGRPFVNQRLARRYRRALAAA